MVLLGYVEGLHLLDDGAAGCIRLLTKLYLCVGDRTFIVNLVGASLSFDDTS